MVNNKSRFNNVFRVIYLDNPNKFKMKKKWDIHILKQDIIKYVHCHKYLRRTKIDGRLNKGPYYFAVGGI